MKVKTKKKILRIGGIALAYFGSAIIAIPILISFLAGRYGVFFPDAILRLVDHSTIYFSYLFCFVLSAIVIYVGFHMFAELGCEWKISELDDGIYIVTKQFRSKLRLIARKEDLHDEEKRITLIDSGNSLHLDTVFQISNGKLQKVS